MARPPRLNIAGLPQHVTQRGNNRQACFIETIDYEVYLAMLDTACLKHVVLLHAYVLMTNHVHLLLTPTTPNGVSLVFRDLGRDYVRRFNKRHERTGTLWEGRFKSSVVETDRYLLACYRYIELNPVRAGLVRAPSDYPWCSYEANALGVQDERVTPHSAFLALGKDAKAQRLAYRSLFEETPDQQQDAFMRHALRKGLPTGGVAFRDFIENTLSIRLGSGKKGRPRTTRKTAAKNVSGPI